MTMKNVLLSRVAAEMFNVIDGIKDKSKSIDEAHAITRAGAVIVDAIATDIDERRFLKKAGESARTIEATAVIAPPESRDGTAP